MGDTYSFKYVIVGDKGVGKSCLLLQFTDQRFQSAYESTIGAPFGTRLITVNKKQIKLHIWDTAGEVTLRPIAHGCHREVAAAILVYDITKRVTFDRSVAWINNKQNNLTSNMVITLVGNKCDLSAQREVQREEGEAFAHENGMIFMETSAKTAANVEEVFIRTACENCNRMEKGAISSSNDSHRNPSSKQSSCCCM